jgi:hypothetical protein
MFWHRPPVLRGLELWSTSRGHVRVCSTSTVSRHLLLSYHRLEFSFCSLYRNFRRSRVIDRERCALLSTLSTRCICAQTHQSYMVEKSRRYRQPPLNYDIAACLGRSRFVLGLDLWYPAIAFLESKDQFPKIAFQGSDDDQAIFTKSWFSRAYISLATRSLKNDTVLRKLFLNGAKRAASEIT